MLPPCVHLSGGFHPIFGPMFCLQKIGGCAEVCLFRLEFFRTALIVFLTGAAPNDKIFCLRHRVFSQIAQ